MLASFPVSLIVGTLLGFLSGLGIGGGSLLILWLTIALDMDPLTARSINLLFFIPAALAASFLHLRRGKIKIRPLLPTIAAGCISAFLFARISADMDVEILKKLFGIVLLAAGSRELLYRDRKAR